MRAALYWYVAANDRGTGIGVDAGLILAQTALQHLAWTYCVQDRKMVSAHAFGRRGLSAADRIRLLATALDIPTDLPASLRLLHAKRGSKWDDGADVITGIRNSLVHPAKKSELVEGSYYEAWKLSLRFLDLVFLRLLGHEGECANRLAQRMVGEVETVPWARSLQFDESDRGARGDRHYSAERHTMTEKWQLLNTLFRRSFGWSTITRLGRNRLLQTSFIWFLFVPIAIRLLKFSHQQVIDMIGRLQAASRVGEEGGEEPQEISIEFIQQLHGFEAWLIKSFGDDFAIPFTWKMFYLAAVCVALATTIYTVLCPPIIKFYKDARDYIEKSGNSGSFLIHHLDVLLPRDDVFFTPYGKPTHITKECVLKDFLVRFVRPCFHDEIERNFRKRHTAYSYTALKPSCIDHVGDAYWFVRFVADWTLPVARLVCTIFYLVALGCVGIVLIEYFVFVIKHWLPLEETTLHVTSYIVGIGFFIFVGFYLFIKTSYRESTAERSEKHKKGSSQDPQEGIEEAQQDTSTDSSRPSQDDQNSGPPG